MIHETINLTQDGRVKMETYLHKYSTEDTNAMETWRKEPREQEHWQIQKMPAVIVMPGGAYVQHADREGEPVALTFMKEGFQTFVLYYSIGKDSAYPVPLEDAAMAVWEVRKHAEEWNIDENAITVMGFSAGAHLAALLSTQWNRGGLEERLQIPKGGSRPNAAVIGYGPVRVDLCADGPGAERGEMIENPPDEFQCDQYISEDVPPMFIWHTGEDPLVSPENALLLSYSLQKQGRPYELHLFQKGTHALSVNNDLTDYKASGELRPCNAAAWVELCVKWMKDIFLK